MISLNPDQPYRLRGLGQATAGQTATAVGTGIATSPMVIAPIAEALTPTLVGVSPAFLSPSLAIPVVGAAIAGIGFAVMKLVSRKGPQQKVAASKFVDEIEQYMQSNLSAWESSNKTKADQQQALSNFDQLWNKVVETLSQSQFGEPGQRGVHDRARGGKWDWFNYYRDPIANDPDVKENPTIVSSLSSYQGLDQMASMISGSGWGTLAIGGLLLGVGLLMFGGDSKDSRSNSREGN